MKKRVFAVLLALLMLPGIVSCSDGGTPEETSGGNNTPSAETAAETEPETVEIKPDLPEGLKFDDQSFTFGVIDNPNARNLIVAEELTGEVLNDAQYTVIQQTDETLGISVSQNILTTAYPGASALKPLITAGDDTVQVANMYCVDAPTLMVDGYLLDYKNVPYVDLDKPYWDSSVNSQLYIGGMRYSAIGDLNVSTHDLTYVLLFNKELVNQFGLNSPYDQINAGTWTIDNMKVMMETATVDTNGNGTWEIEDNYGYAAHTKMTLPSFWIGGGFQTIALNEEGIPTFRMNDEALFGFLEKIYAMTYDNNSTYNGLDRDNGQDVPDASIKLFREGRALFMDCSLFWISPLRDMETDFGIIPYPKRDEAQKEYHARVSYYMAPVVPVTVKNLELTGAVLETANWLAKREITPAYYDKMLKGKVSRDEESVAMLDLIFANRVVDLGDTLFCSQVRDGFVAAAYKSDNRDFASLIKKNGKVVEKSIEKTVNSIIGGE